MEKMIIGENEIEDNEITITEESLISLEKLDRASPDLWPEQNITKFVAQNSPQPELPGWTSNLTNEDMSQLYKLGNLSINELILEAKKLLDTAYQLGCEEAKEMTRGKYLNIFKHK